MADQNTTQLLKDVPLFDGLSRKERDHVARWADVIDLPTGYHLADQGAFAHEFFALLDGWCDAVVAAKGYPGRVQWPS